MCDTDSEKQDRLKRTASAFSNALTSVELTLFDQLIFVDQYMNVLVGNDVHSPSIHDKNVRYIRADRLKFLGYRYVSADVRWTKA